MDDTQFFLYPSPTIGQSVVDLPLDLVFQCFTVSQVLTIITCLLTEQKIIFLSKNYTLLSIIIMVSLKFLNHTFKTYYTL